MPRVHLVDGTYELFRMYYGAPSATAPDGTEVGATRALIASLASLVQQQGATHVAIAFDHVIESFRNEMFDGYKRGDGIDPLLLAQFPLAEQVAEALGMISWPMVEFEADDALASAAFKLVEDPEVSQVLICSPDKDLCQCVTGSKVVLLDRRASRMENGQYQEKLLDEAAVIEKHGVEPKSIPDYLALVGDTADGIPGIPKWGAKSSANVLRYYKSLDKIPHDPKGWAVKIRGAQSLAQNLCDQRQEAELYRQLATLRLDVELDCSLETLEWKGADRAKLEALCQRLGTQSPLSRVKRYR